MQHDIREDVGQDNQQGLEDSSCLDHKVRCKQESDVGLGLAYFQNSYQ